MGYTVKVVRVPCCPSEELGSGWVRLRVGKGHSQSEGEGESHDRGQSESGGEGEEGVREKTRVKGWQGSKVKMKGNGSIMTLTL